jgi:hypothetical protein
MTKSWQTSPSALWFVTFPNGQPSLQTASYQRNKAAGYWIAAAGEDWPYWYRRGMRIRKLQLQWREAQP